jgi:Predicted glycosyltransferases
MAIVTIVIAVYNPNITWLKKQLSSINNQTFKDIEIIICDDCPQNYTDKNIFYKTLSNFKPKIFRNKNNLGSNKTFELMTKFAAGKYIAYCDQDDIWQNNKIAKLVEALENSNALLAYSDAQIINENDEKIYDSLKDYSKRTKFYSGKNLYEKLLVSNFITGCTMMVKSDIAKKSIPFEKTMVHDHYLALYCSIFGQIIFVDEKLIEYRRHKKNQTGILNGIQTKKDYLEKRILLTKKRLKNLRRRFSDISFFINKLSEIEKWNHFREIWWQKFNMPALKNLWRMRNYNKSWTMFEIFSARFPQFLFKICIKILCRSK